MPSFTDSRDRAAPLPTHPVSEVLSRYFAMTAPTRVRSARSSEDDYEASSRRRAEELWDALGDFA